MIGIEHREGLGELVGDFWAEHVKTVDPERFRASPHYLDTRAYPYRAMLELVGQHGIGVGRLVDELGGEDGAFGAELWHAQAWEEPAVSRDLLDSALEIDFITRALGPQFLHRGGDVLDIGAGYGRLAHRMLRAFPTVHVHCTDAVDLSRDLCSKYLTHRGLRRWEVVSPTVLARRTPTIATMMDLAVNVHCWSECTPAAISWWLGLLDRFQVRALFIAPHHRDLRAYSPELGGGRGQSYREDLEGRGWRETATYFRELPAHYSKAYYLFQR